MFTISLYSFVHITTVFGALTFDLAPTQLLKLPRSFLGFPGGDQRLLCVHTEGRNKQTKNSLGQCVSEFLSPCISLGILKHKRGSGHHHAFQVLVFWDLRGSERRSGSQSRAGPHSVPRASQRSELRSKVRGARPAPRTTEEYVGPRR